MTTPSPVTEHLHRQLAAAAHAHNVSHTAVAAVITDHHQQTLLLQHNPGHDIDHLWDLPTGPILPGQTIPDALERTIATTGLTIDRITGYLGHHDTRHGHRLTRTWLFTLTTTNPHQICANAGHHWSSPIPGHAHPHPDPGPEHTDPGPPLHAALRAHARGIHPDEASIELLIGHATFLHRPDFTDHFVEPATHTVDGTRTATINWHEAITALDAGQLPCSGGQERILRLAASLADGLPLNLRDALTGIDARGVNLVIAAVLHASGHHPPFGNQ